MKEERYHVALDDYEHGIIIRSLNDTKEDWLVDEPAADIVRKIYALCLDGRGPLQIAKQLEQEKVLIPSAYYASLGRKTRKQYTHPYAWDQKSGKRRIQDLDKLIERIYEDQVLGNISAERYARMSVNYENEQRELVKRVDEDEKRLVSIEQTSLDLKILLKVLRSSTAFEELTPTLVNSLIRRIEVHNNDKSSGHCSVKVDIYFTAIGLIDIPTKDEIKILMEKIQSNPQEYRLTA